MKKFNFSLLLFVLLGFSQAVYSQVTTSSLSGNVSDNNGALPGATVVITHVPTGTQTGTISDGRGHFRIDNLRPGGPYTVTFSFMGYTTQEHRNLNISVGDVLVVNARMEEDAHNLAEVVIFGLAGTNMSSERAGAVTNITERDIALMPTVSRSINDLTRLTPQASGQAIGGGNFRQSFITVDGAAFNNSFGIGGNLPGAATGSPISIDALEQISVSITPYDVRQSGFVGAAINAVTRSGTNEFRGTAYTIMTNERMRGNRVGDIEFERVPAAYQLHGFTAGGPIVRDRLFFFINAEVEPETAPGPPRIASTPGNQPTPGGNVARPSEDEMRMISNFLRERYGYETGPFQNYSFSTPSYRVLARLDWNVNENNRVNVRYSHMHSRSALPPSTSTSPINTGSLYIGNRQSMDAMWFQNSGYYQDRNFTSLSSEWNSSWLGRRLHNTMRGTWSFQNEPRAVGGNNVNANFPFVDIKQDDRPFASFGTELFSFGNLRQVHTLNFTNELMFSAGIHNFTVGYQFEWNRIRNGFMRFGTGFYVFDSWEDFTDGRAPSSYAITFSNTPNFEQAFPSFMFAQHSLYFQNEMRISPRFNLTAGLRLDLPTYPDHPAGLMEHPMISQLDFNGTRYNTATMPRTRVMFSPRLGFNYDVIGDRSIVLRGGTGIFTGRIPFVWICAQSVDAGMLQSTMIYTGSDVPAYFHPDPHYWINQFFPNGAPEAGTMIPSTFAVMDPNFRMPSAWKSSLATDFRLPFGINASVEGIFNRDLDVAVVWRDGFVDPIQMDMDRGGYRRGPDNRLVYQDGGARFVHRIDGQGQLSPTGSGGATPLVVTNAPNSESGYYFSLTGRLEKNISRNFSAMVAYTRSWSQTLNDGFGDQVISAWTSNVTVNGANNRELGFANFVRPHNLIAALSYNIEYGRNFGTTISVFYNAGNSGRASYTYSRNIVNDLGPNNLIYVPRHPSEITFIDRNVGTADHPVIWTAQEQSDAFFAFIEQDSYLRSRRGQYAERGGVVLPWFHQFDLRIMQDIFVTVGGKRQTLQVGLDIMNVGNLLNSAWGNRWTMQQTGILEVANWNQLGDGVTQPLFQLNPLPGTSGANAQMITDSFQRAVGFDSTYWMQFTVRYIFN